MDHRETQRELEQSRVVTHSCPGCKGPVQCEISQGKATCWCFNVMPQHREVDWGGDCLCKSCLTGRKQ